MKVTPLGGHRMNAIKEAVKILEDSRALIIGAGAGMGVDSGLPDFRGDAGFWKAYPPLKAMGISFVGMANPSWFIRDPKLAWGFYGHRLNLYRSVEPHMGFGILKKWGKRKPLDTFVFTSNVDGHFQKAGFPDNRIVECHGSIHHLQCTGRCDRIWSAEGVRVEVNESTMRVEGALPRCPDCGELARPNILMFGDWGWNSSRENVQSDAFTHFMDGLDGPVALIECGAGKAVPTVRYTMEHLASKLKARLIRINAREADVPLGHLGIEGNAMDILNQIDKAMS